MLRIWIEIVKAFAERPKSKEISNSERKNLTKLVKKPNSSLINVDSMEGFF